MTHEIVKTENYLLVVDDSEIKVNDFYYDSNDKESITPIYRRSQDPKFYTGCKKIIAHLPLHNAPFLEGVPLLPPLEDDYVYEDGYNVLSHKRGYDKAREKYKFTEEDIEWAIIQAFLGGIERGNDFNDVKVKVIQSLSQPKIPIAFECEESIFFATNAFSSNITLTAEGLQDVVLIGIKKTTNSQGQTQWVGKYIYD